LTYAGPEKARESQKDITISGEEDGSAACEPHWRLEKIDEALLHLPAGHAFSRGGEAASRTCLHNLKALLETVG
jgi:hypothetical protein